MLKELHECEWKVKGDEWISLVMDEKYIHEKFMNKLNDGTKHEIFFWCFIIMNITFVQWFMVVGWISYVIIILRNNILKIALTKKIGENNLKSNVYQMIKIWFLLVLDNY
jgi:hypothetical protein